MRSKFIDPFTDRWKGFGLDRTKTSFHQFYLKLTDDSATIVDNRVQLVPQMQKMMTAPLKIDPQDIVCHTSTLRTQGGNRVSVAILSRSKNNRFILTTCNGFPHKEMVVNYASLGARQSQCLTELADVIKLKYSDCGGDIRITGFDSRAKLTYEVIKSYAWR